MQSQPPVNPFHPMQRPENHGSNAIQIAFALRLADFPRRGPRVSSTQSAITRIQNKSKTFLNREGHFPVLVPKTRPVDTTTFHSTFSAPTTLFNGLLITLEKSVG